MSDPKLANLQTSRQVPRVAPLHLSTGEFSADEALTMTFADTPLPFLGREDIVFQGTSTVVAAREKEGKSTLVRHLCHGWATEGLSILYLGEEWRRVWSRQLQLLGVEPGVGHFQIVEAWGKSPEELLDRARRGSEGIIVVDTVTWLLGLSLANRDEVVAGLRPWVGLCGGGKTLILLAHLTKRGDLEGSHAFGAGVDTLITYRAPADGDLRVVEVKSRMHAETLPPFAVRKTGTVFTVEEIPHELTLSNPQAEVLEILPSDPTKALSWEEVADKTGFKEGKTRKLLRELVELGLALDVTGNAGAGGRGNAARYVALEDEVAAG